MIFYSFPTYDPKTFHLTIFDGKDIMAIFKPKYANLLMGFEGGFPSRFSIV